MRLRARPRNKELMKERILQVAMEVFAEEGFDSPVDQICKRAGVSKGIFFWHFNTKNQLILEIAKRSLPLDLVMNCLSEGNGEQILRCIGSKYIEKYSDSVMRMLFLRTISVMSNYEELAANSRELCGPLIVEISRRVFNSDSVADVVRIRSFMGGLLCYVINPPEIDKKTYLEALIKISLNRQTTTL
jgi:AcrR family transcriptional regulator